MEHHLSLVLVLLCCGVKRGGQSGDLDVNGERVIAAIPTSRLPRSSLHGLR